MKGQRERKRSEKYSKLTDLSPNLWLTQSETSRSSSWPSTYLISPSAYSRMMVIFARMVVAAECLVFRCSLGGAAVLGTVLTTVFSLLVVEAVGVFDSIFYFGLSFTIAPIASALAGTQGMIPR